MATSFDDTLNSAFVNFSIKSPNTKTSHKWRLDYLHADFIELKALFWARDSWLTLQDVIGHYKDYNEKIESLDDSSDIASENDKWNSRFLEYFQLIKSRKTELGDIYPFEIEETSNYIKLKQTLETPHLIYLSLLVSSNLDSFPKLESILTKDFEKISRFTIEGYLKDCNVIELGKNSSFNGNTIDKIRKISTELNIDCIEEEINKISKYASQEKGLYILAYRPFEDKIASMIMIMIQCACGKDWDSKTNETKSYESFLNFYKFKPIHSMFVPYYISSDNGFKESNYLVDKLVFERKRILEFLEDNCDFFNILGSKQIIEKCISYDDIEV